MNYKPFIYIFCTLTLFYSPDVSAKKITTFISQSYVDSLVDQALYVFSSMSDPASGISPQVAIQNGKKIAARLREIAEDDVNKKFILWKVSELESHIYLEEKGLLLEKEQWKQKHINELVVSYNAELGKKRPVFSYLDNFLSRMNVVDPSRALKMEKSIKSRAVAMAREVPDALDKALESKNYEVAREEGAYCESNRKHLGFSPSTLAQLQAKVHNVVSVDKEQTFLNNDFDSLETLLLENRLSEGRGRAALIKNRLDGLRGRMVELRWTRLNEEYLRLFRKIEYKEDSLVDKAIGLLRSEGITAAETFFDTLQAKGVSGVKVAKVDRMILEAVIEVKKREVSKQDLSISPDTSENTAFSDLLVVAKKRAHSRKDSLQTRKEQKSRLTQVAEVRRERLKVTAQQQQKREQERTEENRRRAQQDIIMIYSLIEKGQLQQASEYLKKVEPLLKENLPDEEFKKIVLSVDRKK